MPVATTSRPPDSGGGLGTCALATASTPRMVRGKTQRGSRRPGPGRPRPVAGSRYRTTGWLRELRVHRLDLLLGPLDGGLEVELVGAELRERVDHDELLIHFVGGRRECARVADREVVVG